MVNIRKFEPYIYPTNDYIFHRVFAREGNEEITKAFLNTILSTKVEEIRLDSNPIQMPMYLGDKTSILDVKAILDENGRKKLCNIEMQIRNQYNMDHRIPYYWAKLYSGQLKQGEDYEKLCKTICIVIVDFEINDKDTDFCSEYGILKKNVKGEDILLTDDLEFYIIELPKLRKKLENAEKIDNKKLVAWLKYINNPNEVEEKDMEDNEYLEEAYRVLEDISSSEEEKILAEYRIDAWRNEQSVKKHWQKETKKEISTNDKLKLEKLENKVQKVQQKLEKAEQKLPKKTKIKFEKSFDEKTKTSKTKFHMEKEVKPQYEVKPIRTVVKKTAITPPRLLWYKGHQKITETEKENTAVEAVHKNEQRAEFLFANGYRRWNYDRKNKSYHTVTKMEKRLQKANTKYHITKFSVENEKAKPEKINKKWPM